jgi:alanyl-tRNA synthetase
MQQHTAQHLLTSLAQDRFGWATTAFHLGEETSDVELDVGGLSTEQLPALEEAIAVEIRAARRVTCCRVGVRRFQKLGVRTRGLPADHRGTVRLVEIRGLDLNTCGGTHLRSTAELESVKLLGTEPMRGGTRVYFAAGGRARRIFQAHERRNAELRSLLGAPDSGLTPAVASRLTQIHELQHHQRMLREELVAAAAEALASHPGDLVDAHFRSGDAGCLERIARQLLERAPQKAALLTGGADSEGFFVVVAGEQVVCDVQALGRQVALLLGGRGGGSGRIFQGRLSSLKKRKDALGLFMVELERD